jgi:hypothetical protein
MTTWSQSWIAILGLSWPAAFISDLFTLSSFSQAQQNAWDKGYYGCIGNEMFPYKGPAAAGATEIGKEAAIETAKKASSKIAGAWYHFTDGRFTAWGKYSKVLVPKAAPIIEKGVNAANAASWAATDYELGHAIGTCSGTL